MQIEEEKQKQQQQRPQKDNMEIEIANIQAYSLTLGWSRGHTL